MKKRMTSLFLALALCLGLLPVTALAAEGDTVYVGGVALTGSSTSIAYAITNESGEVVKDGAYANNYNIKWDGSTLTLRNATIKESVSTDTSTLIAGTAIGMLTESGDAKLTIKLEGTNTIAEVSMGIYVLASSKSTGSASLTITGDGILSASSGFNPGIRVQSNTGNGTLAITGAKVTASSSSSGNGVQIRVGDGSNASLTVNGGSLTATATGSNSGIHFQFGSGDSGSGTPRLTVCGNTIVKASGDTGGITSNCSPVTPSGAGIVFDGGTGTVYGDVTLQDDLEIGEGESLDVSDGAALTVPEDVILVNRGTLNVGTGSSLNNNGALGNAGTTTVDGSIKNAGQIMNTEDGVFSGAGTIVNDSSSGHGSFSNLGSVSDGITVSGNQIVNYVTKVTLDSPALTLVKGDTGSLTAQLTPANATYQGVSWSSDDPSVATVTTDPSGTSKAIVTAVGPGTATITAKADNNGDALGNNVFATCSVTVLERTTITGQPNSITVDAGANATFSVTATGSGSQAYQWQVSTDDGDTWTDVPGATSHSYTVESVTEDMSGTWYRCVVTGDGGVATSEPATLTVAHVHKPASAWLSDEDGHWHACENGCGTRLDAAAHVPETTGEKDATCTDEGYTGDIICSVCGHVIAKGETVPATGHAWGAWAAAEPATCTEDGLEIRTCAACGETQNRIAPASGHSFTSYASNHDATCTEDGTETAACDNGCGATDTRADEGSALAMERAFRRDAEGIYQKLIEILNDGTVER